MKESSPSNKKEVKPIFILSLPRTGSTLLQRILMAHSQISSIAEPHFLLPLVYMRKHEGILAEYSHYTSQKGINDLINNLPNKEEDYYSVINQFATRIYSSLAKSNSIFFLDKTPGYYRIIPDIEKIFPNAKFIFLFRNPIQIYASILTTFAKNRFSKGFFGSYYDLYNGFETLSSEYKLIKEKSYAINYENLVGNPEKCMMGILNYLDLENEKDVVLNFKNQDIKGRMGDPTGVKMYNDINLKPLEKWKSVFNSKFRKSIILKYIKNIEENSFNIQGYDKHQLIKEIEDLKVEKGIINIKDFIDFQMLRIAIKLNLNIHFSKSLSWIKYKYMS